MYVYKLIYVCVGTDVYIQVWVYVFVFKYIHVYVYKYDPHIKTVMTKSHFSQDPFSIVFNKLKPRTLKDGRDHFRFSFNTEACKGT